MSTTNAFSDYLESQLRNFLFRGASFIPSGGSLSIALTHDIPTDASTGASMGEVSNAGSYSRVNVPAGATNWSADDNVNGTTYNNNEIDFATATANWGWVSGVAIVDTNVYGAGNIYFYGALNSPVNVTTNVQFFFPVSGLSIQLN